MENIERLRVTHTEEARVAEARCKEINEYWSQRCGGRAVSSTVLAYILVSMAFIIVYAPRMWFPFVIAIIPGFGLVSVLIFNCSDKPHHNMIMESFLYGASLSIFVAIILEWIAMRLTRSIWQEILSPGLVTTLCEVSFLVVVIITVGGSEELAKFIPMSRAKVEGRRLPKSHVWFYRLVDSPNKYVLSACASGAGFATIENIKYVFTVPGDPRKSVMVALFRGIIDVPFHVCCTGLVAIAAALNIWTPNVDEADIEAPLAGRRLFDPKTLSWGCYICCLLPSVILHGCYDTFLMVAEKPPSLMWQVDQGVYQRIFGAPQTLKAVSTFPANILSHLFLSSTESPQSVFKSQISKDEAVLTYWKCACIGVSMGLYLVTIFIFTSRWREMNRIQGMIWRQIVDDRACMELEFMERVSNLTSIERQQP